jgi:hypothetical protein
MMICENSNLKINDTHKTDDTTDKSQTVLIPKHCNGICKYVCFLIERKGDIYMFI